MVHDISEGNARAGADAYRRQTLSRLKRAPRDKMKKQISRDMNFNVATSIAPILCTASASTFSCNRTGNNSHCPRNSFRSSSPSSKMTSNMCGENWLYGRERVHAGTHISLNEDELLHCSLHIENTGLNRYGDHTEKIASSVAEARQFVKRRKVGAPQPITKSYS